MKLDFIRLKVKSERTFFFFFEEQKKKKQVQQSVNMFNYVMKGCTDYIIQDTQRKKKKKAPAGQGYLLKRNTCIHLILESSYLFLHYNETNV